MKRWRVRDIVDLEAMLAADSGADEDSLALRDRGIGRKILVEGRNEPPKVRVRRWLDARLEAAERPSPGDIYATVIASLAWILFLIGLLVGVGIASGLLVFSSGRPISVTIFFSVTVLWQVLVVLIVALGLMRGEPVRGLAAWALSSLISFLGDRMSGSQRSRFGVVWGNLRARQTIYGSAVWWPVVLNAQWFSIGLNLGVLAALLWLVAISNRAFGWETTLDMQPETMLRIVEVVSWPWTWLPEAHPSLEEIEGSRIALQGNAEYPIQAVTSWWPFLAYSVVTYGLLPRLILLMVSSVLKQRALSKLDFRHAACAQILRRMNPMVADGVQPPRMEDRAEQTPPPPRSTADGVDIVLVSRELPRDGLTLPDAEIRDVEVDSADSNAEVLARLRSGSGTVAVYVEASRPPVKAVMAFLTSLRGAVGDRREVMLVPVREPGARDYTPVWKENVAALGDPYLWVNAPSAQEVGS